MKGRVRVIGFDLDDTLWAIAPVIRRANHALFAWIDARYPRITRDHTPDSLHAVCLEYMRGRPDERHDLTALRKAFLGHLGRQAMYAEDFSEQAFEVFYQARNRVEFFPEVEPVLHALARDYTLVALSNGNACIERTGLSRYFRLAVNSAMVGAGKPDPAMFRHALERLGEGPEAMVHVGDHPEHDVLGAQRAAIRSVWLNREGQAWPGHRPRPTAEIRDLTEISPVLAAMGAGKAGPDV
ncbi:MAG: HAD family hydrolase [Halothiobacillaceae bacterium]|nr:MAG: HAD family hydrolase [Halothiobacillaceae bacterium]